MGESARVRERESAGEYIVCERERENKVCVWEKMRVRERA